MKTGFYLFIAAAVSYSTLSFAQQQQAEALPSSNCELLSKVKIEIQQQLVQIEQEKLVLAELKKELMDAHASNQKATKIGLPSTLVGIGLLGAGISRNNHVMFPGDPNGKGLIIAGAIITGAAVTWMIIEENQYQDVVERAIEAEHMLNKLSKELGYNYLAYDAISAKYECE